MRHFAVAAFISTVVSCASAFAADVIEPASVNWGGFYAGVNAGAAMTSADLSMTTGPSDDYIEGDTYFQPTSVPVVNDDGSMDLNETDFTGGLQAGYNFQHHSFVLGLEADINYLGFDASDNAGRTYPCCRDQQYSIQQEASLDWLGTARAKVGYAVSGIMIYGTGGLAFGTVDYDGSFSDIRGASESASFSEFQVGWSAGAGLEWMMHENASLKLEYLHYDLGEVEEDGGAFTSPKAAFPNTNFDHEASVQGDIVRLGLNWHLN